MLAKSTRARADELPHARARVMNTLWEIEQRLVTSRYNHATIVDEKAGRYEFDCSGMVAWVLRRAAPTAHHAITWRTKGRPLARDYYHHIARAQTERVRYGWQRIVRVDQAQPGDVIAWLRPKEIRSANTGHVAFVMAPPRPARGRPHAFALRIADASRYRHDGDTREGTDRTGFGIGTILVQADPQSGAPVAYGWFGERSAWVLATSMAIGRVAH
jgi:hypothetical protein